VKELREELKRQRKGSSASSTVRFRRSSRS
jgi:hypothetical protein